MWNWIKNTRWTTKLGALGGGSLAIFLIVQAWTLYLRGIEGNPFQTIYRTKVVKVLEPAPLGRSESRQTYECVPIQVIRDKKAVAASLVAPTERIVSGHSDTTHPGSNSEQTESQTATRQPEYPALLQRYKLNETLFAGSIFEMYLLADGSVETKVTYKAPIVELGKLREVGLWVGPELHAAEADSGTGLAVDLSFQQDLFRVGSAWSRLRLEGGYSSSVRFNVKAQIGIPVFRF